MAQTELRTLDETDDGGAPSHGALVFPELIWKHYCWQHALHPERYGKSRNGHGAQNGDVRQLYRSYRDTLDRFEDDAGAIVARTGASPTPPQSCSRASRPPAGRAGTTFVSTAPPTG
jgi:hypothetical protein